MLQVGVADRYSCVLSSAADYIPPARPGTEGPAVFDFVVSNPPYILEVKMIESFASSVAHVAYVTLNCVVD